MIYNTLRTSGSEKDICIIGSGPVGMALALECASLGLSVALVESGNLKPSDELVDASRAEIVDPSMHAMMDLAVVRAFGGTSWSWGGRCVPFDDIDFTVRPYVCEAGWPLRHDDLKPWYEKAFSYLNCETGTLLQPAIEDGRNLNIGFERWSKEPRLSLIHQRTIEQSRSISVYLNSTVVSLDFDRETLRTSAVVVGGQVGNRRIAARHIVLAAGGLESTRLLLALQAEHPYLFNGSNGPLGRFYMAHLSGKIADIVFADPTDAENFAFKKDPTGTFTRQRFMIPHVEQREAKLLNAAFWPDNALFHNPRHGSGTLSAVFLALAFPPIGRKILQEKIRLDHVGPGPHNYTEHIKNIIFDAPRSILDILQILHRRLIVKPRMPGFLLYNRNGRYALHFHAEQQPNPNSRVTLGNDRDVFGLPRLRIDFRVTETDTQSIVRSHNVLDSRLQANGRARLEYWHPPDKLFDEVMRLAKTGGTHQIGTTRMGIDPKTSVVDANLSVYNIRNLHIAASSVLPTSGQANPTLLTTALAVRLAHHLKRICEIHP
jgi:choline dehydrogenase-like flavoprotein